MNMVARRPTRAIAGIVLVDKPSGVTSNRVLQQIKRLFQAEKAGHTGTLDPMATGMLPICLGAATKICGVMLDSSKRYRVTATFGVATDTGDATGAPIEQREGPAVPLDAVQAVVGRMTGRLQQVPPMYSAVKHQGKRLYELARAGREVARTAREIEIHGCEIDAFDWPRLTLSVHCSKGTYVRTLVSDLAGELDTVAHVSGLRRLSVGPFDEDRMVTLDALEDAAGAGLDQLDRWLIGPDAALVANPSVRVSTEDGDALRHGRRVTIPGSRPEPQVRIYDSAGRFVGIGALDSTGTLKPVRIFPL